MLDHIFLIPTFLAQAGQNLPPPAGPLDVLTAMAPMLLIVFMVFHFMVLRPQSNKLRQQEQLLNALKKGDAVITSSGLHGRVAGMEKEYILLEVANNVRVKIEKSHITKSLASNSDSGGKDSSQKSAA